ncbi:MAG TPA: DUF2752 domain-containing protein [Blastocatellia bacterium]|nr:DUF2752 domain-containing protein [Blastocatellia bacterium]
MAIHSSRTVESAELAAPDEERSEQALYLTLAALSGAVLTVARFLPPSPHGVGTHESLGLPTCLFLKLTGLPCPSCGMTTSFAHAAKLHFYDALVAQPFGLLLFFLTVLLVPLSLWLAYRRFPWQSLTAARAAKPLLWLTAMLWLSAWIYKIAAMH